MHEYIHTYIHTYRLKRLPVELASTAPLLWRLTLSNNLISEVCMYMHMYAACLYKQCIYMRACACVSKETYYSVKRDLLQYMHSV